MNLFREFFLHIIKPKRALIKREYLINNLSILNFCVGLFLTLSIWYCKRNYGFMFNFGFIFGISIGIVLMNRYFSFVNQNQSEKQLPGMRFINFENSHTVTNETGDKCCGDKSQFCGWVFGVTSTQGLKLSSAIKQEIHASIKGTKLLLLIPSPKVKRKHLFTNTKLRRDSFEFKRVIELLDSDITSYPNQQFEQNKWGFKYPICITLGKHNKINGKNRIKEEYRWKETNYSYQLGYLESKFKMFRCITKPSTTVYLKHCRLKLDKIYICSVTCREKELWFRYLKMASLGLKINISLWQILLPIIDFQNAITIPDNKLDNESVDANTSKFTRYIAKYMPTDWIIQNKKSVTLKIEKIRCNPNFLWINAFSARLMWGLMEEGYLVNQIIKKLHNKIKKIHLPIYIEDVSIENVELGKNIPIIKHINRPTLNSLGWWCDFDIEYDGGFSLSLTTKVDLMKLRDQPKKIKKFLNRANIATAHYIPEILGGIKIKDKLKKRTMRQSIISKFENARKFSFNRNNIGIHDSKKIFKFQKNQDSSETFLKIPIDVKQAAFDSDIEDSSESCSSIEDLELSETEVVKTVACFKCKSKRIIKTELSLENKILRLIEKLGRSKYFRKASRNTFIKRGIEMFANKKILLELNVQHFKGTIVLHIPRPPSNRMWYGLRPMPDLKFSTIPKIGKRKLNFGKITEWIQKKVQSELEQLLILPNMDDIILP